MQSQFKSDENQHADTSLEQYLNVLSAPLPVSEQEDWREEVRQHLTSLIAAHEELGLSRDEAILAALRSFGEAKTIGKEVARQVRPPASQRLVFRSLVDFVGPVLWINIALAIGIALYALVGDETFLNRLATVAGVIFYICPLVGGWNLGRKTQRQVPVRDMILFPLLGALICLPHALIFSGLQNHFTKPDLTAGLLWFPIGLTATHLSWHWHQYRRRFQPVK